MNRIRTAIPKDQPLGFYHHPDHGRGIILQREPLSHPDSLSRMALFEPVTVEDDGRSSLWDNAAVALGMLFLLGALTALVLGCIYCFKS